MYEDFVDFIKDKDYSYTTASEKTIEDLLTTAEKDKVNPQTIEEIKRAKELLIADKQNDIYKFKDEIKELLKSEIVSRYYYQKGRTEVALKNDTELDRAVEILNNTKEYKKILSK